MKTTDRGRLLPDLERLFQRGTASASDRALLVDFATEGDEAAFEALVNRHGPLVRGVCRRLLANPHDADDAFQATFLVLARKAGRIRDPDRLGPWLYGVAYRVAAKARSRAARRRDRQPIVDDAPAPDDPRAEWSDVRPIIDAELNRLRSKHRDVLILCLIEGATAEEASARLGCPVGTVKSRLARARETLRARLIGRGVTPVAALTLVASSNALASPVPSTLTRATLQAITAKVVPPGVAALATGAASTMFWKSTIAAVALVGCVGLSAAYWDEPTPAQEQPTPAKTQAAGKKAKLPADTLRKIDNLKQLLLAAHNYHGDKGTFPPPAIYGDGGEALLSWRVALLPYLGQEELYQQFHLNEPWDSPHNKTLIERMPAFFETPGAPTRKGETRFRGIEGQGTMFGLGKTEGVRFSDIRDGALNTVFLTVARNPTVWTQPGELLFIQTTPEPLLDESDPMGIILGMADGQVRFMKIKPSRVLLNSLVTISGGEVLDWAAISGDQPSPKATPTARPPAAAREPSVQQRLKTIEEKLDRLLRKLDVDHEDQP